MAGRWPVADRARWRAVPLVGAGAEVAVRLRARCALVVPAVLVLSALAAGPAQAAVTVTRADLSGTNLRVEGTATANRDITVDGAVMGRSDAGGKFRIDATGYAAPPDCTIDVNDATGPRTATLSGCTVRTPPPPPASGQVPPLLTGPGDGASVTSPVTLAWSSVLDPTTLNGGYNWQISTTSTFASLVTRSSTNPATTSTVVGGLVAGTYFWQVQAVNAAFDSSPFSAARRFVVTGAGTGALAAPVFAPLPFGTAYHPYESFPFSWSAVPGASSYLLEATRDPAFPAPVDLKVDNIPTPNYGFKFDDTLIGVWFMRVRAVDANFVVGAASNVITFTITYNAPIGPAPTLLSPANGATVQLPVTLDWADVANPQDLGYEIQVSPTSSFTTFDDQGPITASERFLPGLTVGQHFWRVRAFQGDNSLTTAAPTAFSAVRSFIVSAAAPKISTVTFTRPSAFSGEFLLGELQLTGPAPAGGAVVTLTSTSPTATPLQAVTLPAGTSFAQFQLTTGQVATSTAATVTASYGGASASTVLTVDPTSLKSIGPSPNTITGGAPGGATIALNGSAGPNGAVISLSSSSPLAVVPATVTAPAGSFFQPFTIQTSQVAVTTPVTITATWNGISVTNVLTLLPAVPPSDWTIDVTQTTGSQGALARVAIAAVQPTDTTFTLTSSNPAVAFMSPVATVSAGTLAAGVLVQSVAPTVATIVTLTVSGAGVSKSVTLTVNPFAAPPPPPPGPLAAPALLSPAASARFAPNVSVAFDWADVVGAATYTFQVSSTSGFTSTLVNSIVTASAITTSFPATGDRFWRVRANKADGTAGTWSAARAFRIK